MAEIVLGMWTTHGPTLNTTPDQWVGRLKADMSRDHWFKGDLLSFDALAARRAAENIGEKITDAQRQMRYDSCQTAIAALCRMWDQAAPDLCVILGNDQRELFLDDVQPAFTVYYGDTFHNEPLSAAQIDMLAPGIAEADWAYRPDKRIDYPGAPELAELVFERAMEEGFDLAACKEWPSHQNHHHSGTPHAFSFILRRIMRDKTVPTLPVITNTFFPPNQPTARRCFQLGEMLHRTVAEWDSDARVAVIGSGGMSHFCIDEDLDQRFLAAIEDRDRDTLCGFEQILLQSGSSELRNWIAAAGMVFDTGLSGDIVDYVPCYRSEAGTGTANGFICWT
jgi:OH-DDVA oxygenase